MAPPQAGFASPPRAPAEPGMSAAPFWPAPPLPPLHPVRVFFSTVLDVMVRLPVLALFAGVIRMPPPRVLPHVDQTPPRPPPCDPLPPVPPDPPLAEFEETSLDVRARLTAWPK